MRSMLPRSFPGALGYPAEDGFQASRFHLFSHRKLSNRLLKIEELCFLQSPVTLWMAREDHDLKAVGALLQEGEHAGETARISRVEHVIEHDELAFFFGQDLSQR